MSILVIDCETTSVQPNTARLVQIAAYHMDTDFTHLGSLNAIIYPEGFEIPAEAAAIHGIDTDTSRQRGSPLSDVLDRLLALSVSAASGSTTGRLVAHNLNYDYTVLGNELRHCGLAAYALSELLPFCTMHALTDRCRLLGRYGKYKWPRLGEAYQYCYNRPPPDTYTAHTAMGDVLACRDIYIHGCREGWWSCK